MKKLDALFSNAKAFFQELDIKEVELSWLEGEDVDTGKDMRRSWKAKDLDKVPEQLDQETLKLVDYILVTVQQDIKSSQSELGIYLPRKEVYMEKSLDYVLLLKAGKAAEKHGFILTEGDRIEYNKAEASEECTNCIRKTCSPYGNFEFCEFYNDIF